MKSKRHILSIKLTEDELMSLTEQYRAWLLRENMPVSRHEYMKRLIRQDLD